MNTFTFMHNYEVLHVHKQRNTNIWEAWRDNCRNPIFVEAKDQNEAREKVIEALVARTRKDAAK